MKTQEVLNQNGEPTDVELVEANTITLSPAEVEARLAKLEKINPDSKPKAGIDYWEATPGDTIRGIFSGWTLIQPKDKPDEAPIPAAVVRVSPYRSLMSAAVAFAGAFQTIPVGKGVHVVCTEAKSGNAKKFEVTVLD